jgi:hypothetical protein
MRQLHPWVSGLAALGGGGGGGGRETQPNNPPPPKHTPAPAPAKPQAPAIPPPGLNVPADSPLIGRTAQALVALFGQPALDQREGTGRKLQFLGRDCVLDAYLYPRGQSEAVVTHVDARLPDGRDTDRAACAAALARR